MLVAELTIPDLLDHLVTLKAKERTIKHTLEEILDRLHDLYQEGVIDPVIVHDDWTIRHSTGRKSYDYPDEVVALEAQLQEAKQLAVMEGRATLKPQKPSWTVLSPKL